MPETRKDAAGRAIDVGDVVGGTTSGRYQETIIGPILNFGKCSALIEVTNKGPNGGYRPSEGDKIRISLGRVFFVRSGLDDYESMTGHLITCLAVAGGGSDPDCGGCNGGRTC